MRTSAFTGREREKKKYTHTHTNIYARTCTQTRTQTRRTQMSVELIICMDWSVIRVLSLSVCLYACLSLVAAGSPSRGGDVGFYVFDINQPSLPTAFYSVLVSISVFMALSTVFYSMNSPDNSPLSHSVLPVLFLPHWSFQLNNDLLMKVFFSLDNPLWLNGLKALTDWLTN